MAVLDSFRLDGKVAVVTGGNRGLGQAFARALGEAGARVAIAARDEARSEGVAGELGALAVTTDVTDTASVQAMLETVTTELGPVDVLDQQLRSLLPPPRARGARGRVARRCGRSTSTASGAAAAPSARRWSSAGPASIVNIGSISAQIVNRPQWQPAYNASKAAVHQLTKSLAAEWAPFGVRVNALAPGYVKTEMAPVDDPRFRSRWVEDAPMQRAALPEELGPSIVYLASDASSFMTGSVLVVDGGYTLF